MDKAEHIAYQESVISAIEILRAAAERAGDTASAIGLAEAKSDAESELASIKASSDD